MKGYDRFDALVNTSLKNRFYPVFEKMAKAYLDGSTVEESTQSFAKKFIFGFTEISSSLEAMELAETFIKSAGLENSPTKNTEYLRYHVHAYLQESYILKNRLENYAKKLNRLFKNLS